MSMNVGIYAEREIVVVATGAHEKQVESFNTWQTPTEVTHKIINAPNPLQAYRDWVREVSQEVEEPVYEEDDIFCLREPIGTVMYNPADDHLAHLDEWIELVTKVGYGIFVEMR